MYTWRARSILTASGAITCAQSFYARRGNAKGTFNPSYLSVVSMLHAGQVTIVGELPWEVLVVGSVIDSALRCITADGFVIRGCVVGVLASICEFVIVWLRCCGERWRVLTGGGKCCPGAFQPQ